MSPAEQQLRTRLPLKLENGLQIRFPTPADIEPYMALVARVYPEAPALHVSVRELLDGTHPRVDTRDHLLVEETASGRPVSYMCLISRSWSYGGIPFGCGHVESIGTDPDFRQRGLVRRQFEVIHQLSAARGELLQVIWGIPWYYRNFGYTYALPSFGGGSWQIPISTMARLAEGETEHYGLRPIQAEDRPLVRRLYQQWMQRGIFADIKDDAYWTYLFEDKTLGGAFDLHWRIITGAAGQAIGYLTLLGQLSLAQVTTLELLEGYSYLQLMPGLLRQLARLDQEKPAENVKLLLPRNHPAGRALPAAARSENTAQALYLRIPDVVAFLRHVRPALERNLVGTAAEGYSGELKINCLSWGVLLQFERGRILAIEPWLGEGLQRIHHLPRFVDGTFIQLIGGFKRCAQLMEAHPDCYMDEHSARLLDALFPQFHGGLWINGL